MRVWDLAVRVLHWALAASVVLSWVTTVWFVHWHQPVGWAAAVLVTLRLIWGFAGGGRYARYAQFVRGPAATWRYLRLTLRGQEPRYIGHNPLGAWMVLALAAGVLALVLTGWLYTTDLLWGDATVEWFHRALAWSIAVLAALHVGGVVFTSVRQRENLVVAMFDGRKRTARDGDIV